MNPQQEPAMGKNAHITHNLNPKLDEDLSENPGIGQSQGAYAMGGDMDDADGENTVEGDVENDPAPTGGLNPERVGHRNK
jgi:hypothetical protein